MSRGQYFIHLACSLHHGERVFFWAVYNNTCALYFPQINGNARGATQDGCHWQVNLSTAEQRGTQAETRETSPIHWDEPRLVVFWIGLLIAPICCVLLCLTTLLFFKDLSTASSSFFCPFVCVEYVIVCLAQGGKGEGEKSGNGLPGDHFLETVQEADGRAG